MRRRRRWIAGAALGLIGLLAAGAVALPSALRMLGRALIVDDPLAPADAIVVLAGGMPFREQAAAALFKTGLAPRIVVSRPFMHPGAQALVDLGVRRLDLQGESRAALLAHGVPASAILALAEPVRITETELRGVHRLASANGYRRVILVTSADHTRRVKAIWSRAAADRIEGLVHPVSTEEFSPDGWWRKRRMAEAVLHEYLGLAAIYLGISHWME